MNSKTLITHLATSFLVLHGAGLESEESIEFCKPNHLKDHARGIMSARTREALAHTLSLSLSLSLSLALSLSPVSYTHLTLPTNHRV